MRFSLGNPQEFFSIPDFCSSKIGIENNHMEPLGHEIGQVSQVLMESINVSFMLREGRGLFV